MQGEAKGSKKVNARECFFKGSLTGGGGTRNVWGKEKTGREKNWK